MFTFTVIVLVLEILRLSLGDDYPKCCDLDSVLKISNFSFTCAKDENFRVQMITNETIFSNLNKSGLCLDIDKTEVKLYEIFENRTVYKKTLQFDYFPKCCPLNYFYNTTTHGCVKASKLLKTPLVTGFIKIGLRECNIIVDYKVGLNESIEDYKQHGLYCVDNTQFDEVVVRVCVNDYKICESMRCVHKCCPDGQSFIDGANCYDTYVYGVDLERLRQDNIEDYNDTFAIVHGYVPRPIYPLNKKYQKYFLDKRGIFTMEEYIEEEGRNVTRRYAIEDVSYCIEHAQKKTINSYLIFRGLLPPEVNIKFQYTRIAMAISCIFLTITILYYCCSKEKRTVFGKTLISYCSISLIVFLLLCFLAFRNPGGRLCRILAFLVFYSTLSSFTWMNVMCIDIYWTFGSSNSFTSIQEKSKEWKRFLFYGFYGWIIPAILTILPLIFYHIPVLPPSIEIVINERKCFIDQRSDNYSKSLFWTSVIALIELCNVILFIRTAVYCMKVKKEIARMNDTHALKGEKKKKFNQMTDRFGLLLKLFLIMGVSFLFEVFSSFYDFKMNSVMAVVEIVWDSFNCLQGLFIFLIFIMKKRILESCGKNIGLNRIRKCSLMSSATTTMITLPSPNHKNGHAKSHETQVRIKGGR